MKVAIIGGGAAGLMCAATISELNKNIEVHLFEKNGTLGVKVSISGGGRCNVTTGINDQNLLLSKYIRGSNFLKPAMSAFSPKAVFDWFESHGVPLKIEEDLRVFPQSDEGKDIVNNFIRIFEENKVNVHYREAVAEISILFEDKFTVATKLDKYEFDYVVLTTGGNAYRHTGSSGDGYKFAQNFGHTITKLGPSLNSFEVKENWVKDLKGVSFQDARIQVKLSTGEKQNVDGPILFTHFGLSGPAIFASAAHLAFEEINKLNPLTISILPNKEYTFQSADKILQDLLIGNGSKLILNILKDLVPRRFLEKIMELANVPEDRIGADLKKKERSKIAHLLSGELKITLVMRRAGDEFVTAGGITLTEVSPKTMQSKLNPKLYFAGEILDVDGLTGGFNLQCAWATGRMAGKSIVSALSEAVI